MKNPAFTTHKEKTSDQSASLSINSIDAGTKQSAVDAGAAQGHAKGFSFGNLGVHEGKNTFPEQGSLQAKLMINQPDDAYEQEANTVADEVMGMPAIGPNNTANSIAENNSRGGGNSIQVQRKENNSGAGGAAPPLVHNVLDTSTGKPLSNSLTSFMEPRFGYDFSKVRVHNDERAASSAESVNAYAYTVGNNIVFNKGAYAPDTYKGRWLLAHELTHVAQQGAAAKKDENSPQPKAGYTVQPAPSFEETGQPQHDYKANSTLHKKDINAFAALNPGRQIAAKQQMLLRKPGKGKVQLRDNSGSLRRCGGGAASGFPPATGKKTKTLKGTFGDFKVEHGLTSLPSAGSNGEYYIRIDMTPNAKTGTSTIGFLQSVRRGTSTGNWSVKATDSGMDADRAARATSEGWRVDRADPSADKTPLYGMKKNAAGAVVSRGNADTGKYKGANPWMYDKVGVVDPSVLQFSTTAIDVATGAGYGAIGWGFEYDTSRKYYKEEDPVLLSKGDYRLNSRDASITKWNSAVATTGSGIDAAPAVTD
jgi:hypothetical protein